MQGFQEYYEIVLLILDTVIIKTGIHIAGEPIPISSTKPS